MASPFFDAISAGVTGNPGTGVFTIGTVTAGFRAFTNVPANSIVQYRAEEGTAWEIGMGLWNGTTLTRKAMYSSAANNALVTFTSAAIISLTVPADKVMPHLGTGAWAMMASNGATLGATPVTAGSWAAWTQAGQVSTYAASGNCYRGVSGTGAHSYANVSFGMAYKGSATSDSGFEFLTRFGIRSLPTNAKIMAGGMAGTTIFSGLGTAEATDAGVNAGFHKNSTDTTFRFRTGNSFTDTGITPVSGAVYEVAIWCGPGANAVTYGSIAQLGTSNIWFGSDAVHSNKMQAATSLNWNVGISTSATTGTVGEIGVYSMFTRSAW